MRDEDKIDRSAERMPSHKEIVDRLEIFFKGENQLESGSILQGILAADTDNHTVYLLHYHAGQVRQRMEMFLKAFHKDIDAEVIDDYRQYIQGNRLVAISYIDNRYPEWKANLQLPKEALESLFQQVVSMQRVL